MELIKVRASQLNGCAFCLDMHTQEALKHGERVERLSVLPGWRTTQYFTERERAALGLVEQITMIDRADVTDEHYDVLASVLTEAELSAVSWLAAVINTWNRIALLSGYTVGDAEPATAETVARPT